MSRLALILSLLVLAIPGVVPAETEVRVACSEVAANGYGELQLASWSPMGPVVPNGRSEYLSELVEGVQPQALVVDITPILKDALASGTPNLEIVAGPLSPEALGIATLVALENEVGIWARIHLQYNTLQ
jgi:hypothetical protein